MTIPFAICLLLILAIPAAPAAGQGDARRPFPGLEAGPRFSQAFAAGDSGYQTFRIPSVIATPAGTLLAFAEGRRISAGDAGDIDLVSKRSRDGGVTWSALQVIGDNGPNTFGNPCPVVDGRTGAIWLLTTQNLGSDHEKEIVAGTSKASRTIWLMKSTDDGATWSAATEITASTKRPDWTWYATGPGIGIQTANGRLVVPANHAMAGTAIHHSHVVFSDDGGTSWQMGGSADAGTNESQIVELADGRLMLNMRNHPPRSGNFRMIATSSDGGQTWSKAVADPVLIEPPAQASLLRLTTASTSDRNTFRNFPRRSRRSIRSRRCAGCRTCAA